MSPETKQLRLIEATSAILAATNKWSLPLKILHKALFYLDLAALRDLGEEFTHSRFIAFKRGPSVEGFGDLIKTLEEQEIVVRLRASVMLTKNLNYSEISEEVVALATPIAGWLSGQSVAAVSKYSCKNAGWLVAYGPGHTPSPINMSIAMQQIIETDPWVFAPMSDELQAAAEASDNLDEGAPW